MENKDTALAKHTDYPATNTFGDAMSKTSQVVVEMKDDEGDRIPGPRSATTDTRSTTKVDIPSEKKEANYPSELDQFAIEDNDKNTASNPTREGTNCIPILVRKAHSYEVLPRPFKTTNQFICCAYLSVICCCFCGAIATHWAWETKLRRNKGLYSAAKKSSKKAFFWIIVAVSTGGVCLLINLILYFTGAFDAD